MHGPYQMKTGIQVHHHLDSAAPNDTALVEIRGKYLELRGDPKRVVLVLRQAPATVSQIASSLRAQNKTEEWDAEKVISVLRRLSRFGLLDPALEPEAQPERERNVTLILKLPILPYNKIRWLTDALAPLHNPAVTRVAVPLLMILQMLAWVSILRPVIGSFSALGTAIHALRPSLFLALAIGNYFGLFLHELGHASACAYCDKKHGPIGICLYWVLPGLYTEVNEAWQLPRMRRLIVDVGGIYFSLICAAITLTCFMTTGNTLFALLCGIYDFTVLINLIPFIHMDGYWMISDALGVNSLMRANRDLTRWGISRLLGISAKAPEILNISRAQRTLYYGYYLGFLAFGGYLLWQLGAWYIPQLVHVSDTLILSLVTSAKARLFGQAAKDVLRLILVSIPGLGLFLYFGRTVKNSLLWIWRILGSLNA